MQRGAVIFIGIGVILIAATSAFLIFLIFLRPNAIPAAATPTAVATPLRIETGTTAVATSPPSTPIPPEPIASPTTPNSHTIQAGETLFSIAQSYGITVEALMEANNLTDHIIYAGDVLTIPQD